MRRSGWIDEEDTLRIRDYTKTYQEGPHCMVNEEIKKIIGELDLRRLRKQLGKTGFGPLQVSIGDLFACGCYFIKQGKKELGESYAARPY